MVNMNVTNSRLLNEDGRRGDQRKAGYKEWYEWEGVDDKASVDGEE